MKLINVNDTATLAALHSTVVDSPSIPQSQKDALAYQIASEFTSRPYTLCQFKPAYGHIFSSYIPNATYSHWAYSDLDIIFGDLPRHITNEELSDFDIVTYSYGDQNIAYLRGQFTLHRNSDKVNNLWRGCTYLSKRNDPDHHGFESAEGCYSLEVLKRDDVNVKWSVKADTDFNSGDPVHSTGLYMTKTTTRTVIYKAASDSPDDFKALATANPKWWKKDKIYKKKNSPLQLPYGKYEFVENAHDRNVKLKGKGCMFWAPMSYQPFLCLVDMEGEDKYGDNMSRYNLYLLQGRFMKRKYRNVEFESGVVSLPFFHFQEWKRRYRDSQVSSLLIPSGDYAVSYIISSLGVMAQPWNDTMSHGPAPKILSSTWKRDTSSIASKKIMLNNMTSVGGGGEGGGCGKVFPLPKRYYCGKFISNKKDGR